MNWISQNYTTHHLQRSKHPIKIQIYIINTHEERNA